MKHLLFLFVFIWLITPAIAAAEDICLENCVSSYDDVTEAEQCHEQCMEASALHNNNLNLTAGGGLFALPITNDAMLGAIGYNNQNNFETEPEDESLEEAMTTAEDICSERCVFLNDEAEAQQCYNQCMVASALHNNSLNLTTGGGLVALPNIVTAMNQPIGDNKQNNFDESPVEPVLDEGSRTYTVPLPDGTVQLISYGADEEPNTADDILIRIYQESTEMEYSQP